MIHILYSYGILNGAIVISYILSRVIQSLPFMINISQTQRLDFARFSFITVIATFLFVSYFSVIKNINDILEIDLINLFVIGFSFSLWDYIKNIRKISQINSNALCYKKLNRIHILFSNQIEIPFCGSFIKNYFIVLPNAYLEKSEKYNEIKLAIRHELQHIRQGDTGWLHIFSIIRLFCFWNPFIFLWMNWMKELQEYACDETLVVCKKTSPVIYAQCLINSARPKGVL